MRIYELYPPQAAYNNSSEVELNDSLAGEVAPEWLGAYPFDTKIAKQFDNEWCEGAIQRYDQEEDWYWILYGDGDSEEFDADEVRQGVLDYQEHMQPTAADSSDVVASGTAAEVVPQVERMSNTPTQSLTGGATDYIEMSTAIATLAKAAQQLTAVAESLAAQSQQQQQQQQQQQTQQQQQHQTQQQQQTQTQQQTQQHAMFLHQQQLLGWHLRQQQLRWYYLQPSSA
jgi:hypothetical protein